MVKQFFDMNFFMAFCVIFFFYYCIKYDNILCINFFTDKMNLYVSEFINMNYINIFITQNDNKKYFF